MSTTATPNLDSHTTSLIVLLDYYNNLKGIHLFARPDPSTRPETTLPLLPTDGTPIAIQMNTAPSLATHLLAHNKDLQALETLSEEIRDFLKHHPQAAPAAHNRLNVTYCDLLASHHLLESSKQSATAGVLTPSSFNALTNLPQKLAALRQAQHHLPISSPSSSTSQQQGKQRPPPEFVTNLVADIDSAGKPDPMLRIYLPVTTEWAEFKQVMAMNTHCRWTHDDGAPSTQNSDSHTSSGGNSGGGGGKWVYQRTSTTGRAENVSRPLEIEEDFRDMRSEIEGTEGKEWSGAPLVWHVSPFCLSSFLFLSSLFTLCSPTRRSDPSVLFSFPAR